MSELEQAYQFCQNLAKSHYENFPVASIFLPKKLRRPISVIYAFARTADDFADEGDAIQQQRLKQLDKFSAALKAISDKNYRDDNPIFIALEDVIAQHQLPISLFEDLLDAFKQDVVKSRYDNFDEVLDYCKRSANPVGRLLLLLAGEPSQQQLQQSDAICSALQLINFYQDIVQDLTESDRIYIPTDELQQFGVNEHQLTNVQTENIAPLIRQQYQRTQELMSAGTELGASINGRIGWEIRAMTLGGVITLKKLVSQNDNALLERPRLSKQLFISIMFNSLFKKRYRATIKKYLTLNLRS